MWRHSENEQQVVHPLLPARGPWRAGSVHASLSAATLPQELERVKKDFPVITKAETTEQTMKAANTVALIRHVTFPSRWYQLFQLE